jgi:hypothetical protein
MSTPDTPFSGLGSYGTLRCHSACNKIGSRLTVTAIETAYSVRATIVNSPISVPRATTMIARKTLLMPGPYF